MRSVPALGRIVFGAIFGGFALFWTSAAWLIAGSAETGLFGLLFPLFGVPFIVVGGAFVLSGVRSLLAGGDTVYALSDQRVLIIAGGRPRSVRSLDLKAIRGVERTEGEGGAGTITLLIEGTETMREVLVGVRDVARVGAEIEKLRAASPPAQS